MTFQLGDTVRHGTCVGTVTDVGSVLIQVRTSEGTRRVFCPWELVKIHSEHEGLRCSPAAIRLLPCSIR